MEALGLPQLVPKPTLSQYSCDYSETQNILLNPNSINSTKKNALIISSSSVVRHPAMFSNKTHLGTSKVRKTESIQDVLFRECKISSKEVNRRYQHASVMLQNKLFVYGGYESDEGILSDFKVFEEINGVGQWKELSTQNGPGPRHSHEAVIHNNIIYIFGGKTNRFDNTSTLFGFNIQENCWSQILAQSEEQWWPEPIDSHKTVINGDQMYVYGGFKAQQYSKDIFSFNFVDRKWKIIYNHKEVEKKSSENNQQNQPVWQEQVPKARSDCSLVYWQNKLYIFGGRDLHESFEDFWLFDLITLKFKKLPSPSTTNKKISADPRSAHTAIKYQHYMLVFGGITSITHQRDDLLCYSFLTGEWWVIWNNSHSDSLTHKIFNDNRQKQRSKQKKTSQNTQINVTDERSFKGRNKVKMGHQFSNIYTEETISQNMDEQKNQKKYRRPLRQEKVKKQMRNIQVEKQATKKKNERKMLLLQQIQGQKDESTIIEDYSPLIESLNNSINVTTCHKNISSQHSAANEKNIQYNTNQKVNASTVIGRYSQSPVAQSRFISKSHSPMVNEETKNQTMIAGAKKVRARDGHTAHFLSIGEKQQMVIFGGDRHKLGYNDVVFINLKFLFTTFFNSAQRG